MIELANAPKPKPLPATEPPLPGQPAPAAAERDLPVSPVRAPILVQPKPLTAFGRRS